MRAAEDFGSSSVAEVEVMGDHQLLQHILGTDREFQGSSPAGKLCQSIHCRAHNVGGEHPGARCVVSLSRRFAPDLVRSHGRYPGSQVISASIELAEPGYAVAAAPVPGVISWFSDDYS